jgi:flagellar motor switch protein FliM
VEPILTPQEIDALLRSAGTPGQAAEVRSIDLVSRDHRIFALLPELQECADRLAFQAARIGSQVLRTACKVQADPVEVLPGARLRDLLAAPRFVNGFRLGANSGAGIIALDGVLGGAFIERQFGGDIDNPAPVDAPPTATERRTAGRLAAALLSALQVALHRLGSPEVALEEDVPALVKDPSRAAAVVLMTLRVSFSRHRSTVIVALDTSAAGFRVPALPSTMSTAPGSLAPNLHGVTVELRAVLGLATVPVQKLLSLQLGETLMLDAAADALVPVQVGGRPKFAGAPVLSRGSLSVRISHRIEE